MYLTQSNLIRGLSKREYLMLRMMCFFSKNLYNVTLYNIRQYYFAEKKYLRYESNYHVTKDNENYKLLQAGVSQQTMKVVDRAFQSFFALTEKAHRGEYRFQDIKLPKYRAKGSLFNLILQSNAISIKGGFLAVPMSNAFMSIYGREKIKIKIPEHVPEKSIKEIRIIPILNGKKFKIQYVYEVEPEPLNMNQEETLAIDVGLENLATCISTVGTSFIMNGRAIKSINRLWNKRRAELQSRLPQGQYTSNLIRRLTLKRNNRVNDCIKKTARYIVNHCIEHNIGTIVCGYNLDFERGINLGKKTNQNFTQISFGNLREQIKNLCIRYGMQYLEQEESYTSKASFLDLDFLPVYNADNPQKYEFSGKRIKRGLYQVSDGRKVNADLNGAANILRKSSQNFDFEELSRGLLASPLRIKLA
ncbi:MAG: transposase [Selenomonadaceae bacterium]|nr:transposase [Selenomonadaceae bacterium]